MMLKTTDKSHCVGEDWSSNKRPHTSAICRVNTEYFICYKILHLHTQVCLVLHFYTLFKIAQPSCTKHTHTHTQRNTNRKTTFNLTQITTENQ